MQTLDIERPEMPDLQFVLLVTALCTSQLTLLNVPEPVRTTLFNRCWTLLNESPPPNRPEERVLDLRPWTEVTLDAMVETIRRVLTEAGIRTLAWDHAASDPQQISTAAAQPLINRLERLYPHPSKAGAATSREVMADVLDRLDDSRPDVRQVIDELGLLLAAFPPALQGRAATISATGHAPELADKLLKGAEVMRDSGNMYLAWARHYAGLAEGEPDASEDDVEAAEFGP